MLPFYRVVSISIVDAMIKKSCIAIYQSANDVFVATFLKNSLYVSTIVLILSKSTKAYIGLELHELDNGIDDILGCRCVPLLCLSCVRLLSAQLI